MLCVCLSFVVCCFWCAARRVMLSYVVMFDIEWTAAVTVRNTVEYCMVFVIVFFALFVENVCENVYIHATQSTTIEFTNHHCWLICYCCWNRLVFNVYIVNTYRPIDVVLYVHKRIRNLCGFLLVVSFVLSICKWHE